MSIHYAVLSFHIIDPEFKKSHFSKSAMKKQCKLIFTLRKAHHVSMFLNSWPVWTEMSDTQLYISVKLVNQLTQ